ncbi:hypothetical protein Fuma_01222 [Fuerstiella marisgermanici]|uniref:Uncharacterized protein n=1 Tax=Fuerstiella marisgermanici TaxID=1891926 RepID=A0A1P8WC88_9PLAN|nr:hypothetical protein Fuma_01222 [Fuerstiella marisgermanici]
MTVVWIVRNTPVLRTAKAFKKPAIYGANVVDGQLSV